LHDKKETQQYWPFHDNQLTTKSERHSKTSSITSD